MVSFILLTLKILIYGLLRKSKNCTRPVEFCITLQQILFFVYLLQ